MCIEINNMEYKKSQKTTYSIKKILKALFKKQQQKKKIAESLESLESIDNLKNLQMENSLSEIDENAANEKIYSASEYSESDFEDDADSEYVPVHFARTEHGTFFWTTTTPIAVDADLIQPVYCCTGNQIPVSQFQDRWAQA